MTAGDPAAILDALGDPVFAADADGAVLALNPAARTMVGAAAAGATRLAALWAPGMADEDREALLAAARRVAGGLLPGFVTELRWSGDERWYAVRLSRAPGARAAVVAQFTDVSARRELDAGVRRGEARLAAVIGSAMDAVISIDGAQRITVFNPMAERMFGWRAAEIIGQPLELLLPARFRDGHAALVAGFRGRDPSPQRMGTGRIIVGLRRDGREFPIEAAISRAELGDETVMTATVRDVGDRLALERDRDEHRERWRLAVDFSRDGVWDWDVASDRMWQSERFAALLGHPPTPLIEPASAWAERIHPDERAQVLRLVQASLAASDTAFEAEYRVRHRDGGWRWIRSRGGCLRDGAGVAVRMLGIHADVTGRREAEEALRASEQRFREMAERIEEAFWRVEIAPWRIGYANPACERLWGRRRPERDEDPEAWLAAVHPDDRAVARASLAGERETVEYRVVAGGGHAIWIRQRATVIAELGRPVRVLAIGIDITSRKLAEMALRVSEARSAAIIGSAIDGILVIDGAGIIASANPAMQRMGGWSDDELVGRTLSETLVPPRAGLWPLPAKPGEGARMLGRRFELSARRRDGSEFPAEVALVPIHSGPTPLFVCHLRDLSESKAAAERMRRQDEHLRQAEKMVALGTLVSGVAHEINNPANFIGLNAPLLERLWSDALPALRAAAPGARLAGMDLDEAATLSAQCTEGIVEGVRRIRRIVADLKGFAREDSEGREDAVDLGEVVASAVRLARHTISTWTTRFSTSLAPDLPTIVGNRQRLEQVVINLIINACQALPDHQRAVVVTTAREGARVRLSVADEGIGIPADQLPRLTEPFFTTKRDIGGTGLGLAITQSIVSEHEGELEVRSQVGVGTTVSVLLPIDGQRQPG